MPLSPGTRLGTYEITGPLGAGGMGEVYRAHDTTLSRDVAIKVLPELFALDTERLARFTREAQTLAALNHPNIAQIYGLAEGALVMELVEGDDLSVLIARGPLLVGDALPIAKQIADALEAAHEQGIIHRDLKPANVKVRPDGTVKVLDFGLAKAMAPEGASASADAMHSPTLTARATQMGVIIGTAAYMAPEQAKGRAVDRRADIWAFGVVLYEMLTGTRLFEAEDVSETLAAVLTRDLSVMSLAADIPQRLRTLLRDCLVRDPKQRLRDIGEARRVMERIVSGADEEPAAPAALSPSRTRDFMWPAIAVIALAAGMPLGTIVMREPPHTAATVRFNVHPPEGVSFGYSGFQLSPDGRHLAFGAVQNGEEHIWVYSFATANAQALPSTQGVMAEPFAWSPDSQQIAFRTADKLKKIAAQGGPAQTICSLPTGATTGIAWGPDDVILVGQPAGPLLRVPAGGGTLKPASDLPPTNQERRHVGPEFLPDGRHFLYLAVGDSLTDRTAYIGSLDSATRRQLPGIQSVVRFSSGHILFLRDGALMAQSFDADRLEVAGEAFLLADAVAPSLRTSGRFTAASAALAYRTAIEGASRLVWFDRAGTRLQPAGPPAAYGDIELSPNERFVAYEAGNPGDIWVLDTHNGVRQRVTSDPSREADPVWSHDGTLIAFRMDREGGRLFSRQFGVVGPETPLLQSTTRDSPASWSRDGKYLAYESQNAIWALPLVGDGTPIRVTEPGTSANGSQISPNGQWIAYQSRELGQSEVFIQSFPQPGLRQRISIDGGTAPRWSHDGTELFYLSPARTLMAAPVTAAGGSLNVGAPVALFAPPISSGDEGEYAVSRTGRFLINVPEAQVTDRPITVIVNWAAGTKR